MLVIKLLKKRDERYQRDSQTHKSKTNLYNYKRYVPYWNFENKD